MAAHALAVLAQSRDGYPSAYVASSVNTHAVFLRRILGDLVAAGLVTRARGAPAGTGSRGRRRRSPSPTSTARSSPAGRSPRVRPSRTLAARSAPACGGPSPRPPSRPRAGSSPRSGTRRSPTSRAARCGAAARAPGTEGRTPAASRTAVQIRAAERPRCRAASWIAARSAPRPSCPPDRELVKIWRFFPTRPLQFRDSVSPRGGRVAGYAPQRTFTSVRGTTHVHEGDRSPRSRTRWIRRRRSSSPSRARSRATTGALRGGDEGGVRPHPAPHPVGRDRPDREAARQEAHDGLGADQGPHGQGAERPLPELGQEPRRRLARHRRS